MIGILYYPYSRGKVFRFPLSNSILVMRFMNYICWIKDLGKFSFCYGAVNQKVISKSLGCWGVWGKVRIQNTQYMAFILNLQIESRVINRE